jgi:hypothetical protein
MVSRLAIKSIKKMCLDFICTVSLIKNAQKYLLEAQEAGAEYMASPDYIIVFQYALRGIQK